MSHNLDDIINILLAQIWSKKEGADRHLCEVYLRSTCQKHLFAEKRLESLTNHIEEYTQKAKDNKILDRLCIEMDFDHCVLSLRSSLEHLAQLINAIIPLNLSPKFTKGERHVTLKNVTDEMNKNDISKNHECLRNLSSYLDSEIKKDWFKDLHDLRITMFHDKFDRLTRTSLLTLEHKLLNLKFLLPSGTAKSLVTEEERNITSYCEGAIVQAERILNKTFQMLSQYLSN